MKNIKRILLLATLIVIAFKVFSTDIEKINTPKQNNVVIVNN